MTLRARVLTTILLSVCLIISAAFAVTGYRDLSQRRDELEAHAGLIAAIQAQGLARPLWDLNLPAVNGLIQALTNDGDFASAVVMDSDGAILASQTIADKITGGTVVADAPIIIDTTRQRKVLGTIQIQLSTESLWHQAVERIVNLIAVLVVTCLAVAVAVLLAFRRIAQPLARIAGAADRLALGDQTAAVPETARADEIGNIARAVERSRQQLIMIEQLRQEQANHLRIVFEGAVDAIVVTDSDFIIESANPAAERIFATTADRLIGRSLVEVIPSLGEAAARSGAGSCADMDGLRHTGEVVPLSVSLSAFTMGHQPKLSAILHDISEHRNAERALIAAREAAEEANRTKSSFLANMSHEIRTPMNAVIGMTRLALETKLTAKQRNYLEKAMGSAQGLLTIINDILDLSKIEADKMVLENIPFHLDHILGELADLTTIRAREKDLELLFDVAPDLPETLTGDPVRLRQVLLNLIGNAVKFTDHGEIVVSATKIAESADGFHCRFSVRDSGVGMTEAEQERLFQSFSQADASTTRKYGGTGLGLAISKRLVAMMGGEIGVESQPGKGSTFWFTLPFVVESARTEPERQYKGSRVLVVDDNATSLDILTASLVSLKFDVTQAQSGTQALSTLAGAAAEQRPFHLVLMDYMMPGIDGIEAAARIKADKSLATTPTVIMVTAYGREEIRRRAAEAGIDGFLVKPITPSVLFDAISDVFAGADEPPRRQRPQIAAPATPKAALSALAGARILLVEDNAVNAELASEFLANRGFVVEVAINGEDAIARIEAQSFDGVLMDCQMPVLDGYEATRRIRKDGRFHDLPIIAMTANAMRGDREKCLDAGMDDYVAKPFEETELLMALGRWVHPARPTAQLPPTARPVPDTDGRDAIDGLAHVDSSIGLRNTGGDQRLYLRLLRRFHATQMDFAEAFRRSLDGPDDSEPLRLAHTLKGLAGTLGATGLQRHAAALEAALQDREMETAAESLDAMLASTAAELQVVLDDIEANLPRTAAAAHPGVGCQDAVPLAPEEHDDFSALCARLRHLLCTSDTGCRDALDTILDRWPHMGERLAPVVQLTERYCFDEAVAALDRVARPEGVTA